MIGLIGAHRVGKTTLMNALAKGPFEAVPISINQMQKNIGYDSSNQNYSFEERMYIQRYLLNVLDNFLYQKSRNPRRTVVSSSKGVNITDRTPLDLIGYTLLSVTEPLTPSQNEELMGYITDCISLTNRYYTDLILVQPGIELVPDSKSAPCDEDMINKLNGIYTMYMMSPQLTARKRIVPSDMVSLDDRIAFVIENVRSLL